VNSDRQTLPIVQRLPDDYLLLIGEVATAWAIQEYELKALAYLMLRIGPKRGRVAVRSPRPSEIVDMVGELMLIDGLKSTTIDLKKFATHLDEIEVRRNTLVHNIWFKVEDRLLVQSLRGAWPTNSGAPKVTRRIEPAGIPIGIALIADLVSAIRGAIRATLELRADIARQLAALPETHHEQVDPMLTHYEKTESQPNQRPPSHPKSKSQKGR
jgi:hypothetical protein